MLHCKLHYMPPFQQPHHPSQLPVHLQKMFRLDFGDGSWVVFAVSTVPSSLRCNPDCSGDNLFPAIPEFVNTFFRSVAFLSLLLKKVSKALVWCWLILYMADIVGSQFIAHWILYCIVLETFASQLEKLFQLLMKGSNMLCWCFSGLLKSLTHNWLFSIFNI